MIGSNVILEDKSTLILPFLIIILYTFVFVVIITGLFKGNENIGNGKKNCGY
jgi:hypothetical protein